MLWERCSFRLSSKGALQSRENCRLSKIACFAGRDCLGRERGRFPVIPILLLLFAFVNVRFDGCASANRSTVQRHCVSFQRHCVVDDSDQRGGRNKDAAERSSGEVISPPAEVFNVPREMVTVASSTWAPAPEARIRASVVESAMVTSRISTKALVRAAIVPEFVMKGTSPMASACESLLHQSSGCYRTYIQFARSAVTVDDPAVFVDHEQAKVSTRPADSDNLERPCAPAQAALFHPWAVHPWQRTP